MAVSWRCGIGKPRMGGAGSSYRELIDEASDGLVVVNAAGLVEVWSRGATRMFGYQATEAVGQAFSVLAVPPEEQAEAERQRCLAAQRGEAAFEAPRRTKDGTLVRVEISIRRIVPADGPPYLAAAMRDITHLRALERTSEADAVFRDLLELAPDAMVIVTPGGEIQLVNAQTEALFGYRARRAGRAAGRDADARAVPRAATRHHRAGYFARPRVRAMGSGLELLGRRKDGSEFPIEISLRPLRDRRRHARLGGDPRRQRAQAARGADARGQPAEERVPREHVARAAHAAQRDHRVRRADAQRQGRSAAHRATRVPRRHPVERTPPAPADQRRARPREGRVGQDGVPARAGRADAAGRRGPRRAARPGDREAPAASTTEIAPEVEQVCVDPARVKQVLYNYLSNAIKFTPDERDDHDPRHARRRSSRVFSWRSTTPGIGIASRRPGEAVRRVPAARRERREALPGHGPRARADPSASSRPRAVGSRSRARSAAAARSSRSCRAGARGLRWRVSRS